MKLDKKNKFDIGILIISLIAIVLMIRSLLTLEHFSDFAASVTVSVFLIYVMGRLISMEIAIRIRTETVELVKEYTEEELEQIEKWKSTQKGPPKTQEDIQCQRKLMEMIRPDCIDLANGDYRAPIIAIYSPMGIRRINVYPEQSNDMIILNEENVEDNLNKFGNTLLLRVNFEGSLSNVRIGLIRQDGIEASFKLYRQYDKIYFYDYQGKMSAASYLYYFCR